ncbi:MAG TPA: dTDP-4-dehydrorhamnose reductase [Propionibacteriaceae bacterium]|nr:dTDP-4-dehydrorhamnose reductase [Propionibacteriaceae bacterium]HBY22108.1 dTDP-4-dehydrorhamnose reductase [Propionibacteriaceae bacterium]
MSAAGIAARTTAIPGLLVFNLPVHGDARGWFKENWQREKMTALGLPDFQPVQNNMSFNAGKGATRGLHAEPWDKLVGLAKGRVLGAWVDLRAGDTFGRTVSLEFGVDTVVFVPRGVANGYQALEADTVYSYLVNDHWSPEALSEYTYLNLADETAAIEWPIPLAEATISAADAAHPRLADVVPMPPRRTLIIGAGGQLGRALQAIFPDADAVDYPEFDVTDAAAVAAFEWRRYGTVINAAAYTAVDAAESHEGRARCWAVNVTALTGLAEAARSHGATLVHISSDYVFDGVRSEHTEDEPLSPLGVYGQTKAAGDALMSLVPRHYLVRTSWVVGDGANFVRTMASLAERGVRPAVVADQFGRLTFASDLAAAIKHLVETGAPFGTYNVTCDGPALTWHDIAQRVFDLTGHAASDVSPTTTEAYGAGKVLAPRPRHSTLTLDKIKAAGFTPPSTDNALTAYLAAQPATAS